MTFLGSELNILLGFLLGFLIGDFDLSFLFFVFETFIIQHMIQSFLTTTAKTAGDGQTSMFHSFFGIHSETLRFQLDGPQLQRLY